MIQQSNKDRDKILGGFVWKFAERISSQGVSFVLSVVLARLLIPEEYGLVAMINIFIVFANVFVTSGFTSALVQKKDADELDFSTIFYCTLATSVMMYGIIYIAAPYIAKFYHMPELCLLTRVYALSLIITSYQTVQQAYISRKLIFKKGFYATLSGTLLSGIIGIVMAYMGYGVWALVAQYIFNIVINMITLMTIISWHPKLIFSWTRAKRLMNYGGKILAGNLLNNFIQEIRQLLIGKFYSPADLALYNRGNQIPNLVSSNLDTTLKSVLFPVMSNYSDNIDRVRQIMRKAIKTSSYVTFFFMTLLAVASEPIIRILLTDKWIDCVPYMQIICVSRMIGTVSGTNIEAIKAIGRSDEVLKLEVFKKPIFLIFVLLSVNISVMAVALTMPLYAIYALYVNMKPTKRLLGYTRKDQLLDLAPATLMCLVIAVAAFPLTFLGWNEYIIMVLQIVVGFAIYWIGSVWFKVDSYYYCLSTMKDLYNKRLRR